jgi:spore coat polysaccharide biosynthesis protein SpsF
VLAPVAGRPMLRLLLDRLAPVAADRVVVATSDRTADDAIEEIASDARVATVRGPEDDVLHRFRLVLDTYPSDMVVRVTADCPLTDPAIVDLAVDRLRATGADYVSNTLVRTYPDGLDVEAFTAEALIAANADATDVAEREHVTPYIYRRTRRFRLRNLRTALHLGDERWTVDTAEDLERIRAIVGALADPATAGFADILAVAPPAPAPRWALVPAEPADAETLLRLSRDPGLDRSAPTAPPPDVAATYDDGAARLWLLTDHGTPRGWIELTVDDGVGFVRQVIAPEAAGAARDLGARALAADLQVIELTVTGGSPRPPDNQHPPDREAIHDR